METFSALLTICAGNSPGTGEFPAQRPVTRSFDVFFDLRSNKRLSKRWRGWWFETQSCPLWRHRNVIFNTTNVPYNNWVMFTSTKVNLDNSQSVEKHLDAWVTKKNPFQNPGYSTRHGVSSIFLIGWRLCFHPIRNRVWKVLSADMDFNMDIL